MRSRKEDEDESWEAEAVLTYSEAAESEFIRLKFQLKKQAGLIKEVWYLRLYHRLRNLCRR